MLPSHPFPAASMLGTRSVPLLRSARSARFTRSARPPPFLPLHPAVPLVAFGGGVWLALDPERPSRVQVSAVAGAGAALRAARLAGCCASMAIDYTRVRRSQVHGDREATAADADTKRHEELQRIAGRAERLRSDAVRQGQRGLASLPALEAEARRTRDEAAAFGEALIARRLEHERRSGANPTPNPGPNPHPDPNPNPEPDRNRNPNPNQVRRSRGARRTRVTRHDCSRCASPTAGCT